MLRLDAWTLIFGDTFLEVLPEHKLLKTAAELGSFKLVLLLPPKMLKNSSFERRNRVLKSWLVWELGFMESFGAKLTASQEKLPGGIETILGTWPFKWTD